MAKFLSTIASLFLLLGIATGQNYSTFYSNTYTATGGDIAINETKQGVTYHKIVWTVSGSPASCTIAIDSSQDGTSWTAGGAITGQSCTSNGSFMGASAVSTNYIRINVTALTNGGTLYVTYLGFVNAPSGASGPTANVNVTNASIPVSQSGTWNATVNTALPAGTNVIGHVIADTGSTTAVTALPTLPAGTNVIGHIIADTGSTTAVTALPALPTGSNTIGAVTQASGPWTSNITQIAGSTLGALANYGTSPGAVLVESTNAFITNIPAVTQSGTWTVQPGNTANTTPWLVISPNVAGTDDPCANSHVQKSSVIISQSNSITELVAASGSLVTYVCGGVVELSGSTTPAGQFKTGTKVSTNCDTGTVNLTANFDGGAATTPAVIPLGNGGATIFKSSAGGQICFSGAGASASIKGFINYVQQ